MQNKTNNYVAKYLNNFNKPKTFKNKKKDYIRKPKNNKSLND